MIVFKHLYPLQLLPIIVMRKASTGALFCMHVYTLFCISNRAAHLCTHNMLEQEKERP